VKEAIRRVFYALTVVGLVSEQIEVIHGSLKWRFYNWLYRNGVPLFDTQWPD
jgi:hypothetical protein